MKILLIATNLPYPVTDGGRTRSFNIIKGLSHNNEIDFIGLSSTKNPSNAITELSSYCRNVYAVPFEINHSVLLLIRSLFSKTPYKVLQYHCNDMADQIKKLLEDNMYDIILSEHIFVEQHIPKVSIPVIPQNIDLNYTVYQRIASSNKSIMSLYSASQWKSLYRYEQKILEKYKIGIALSTHEEKLMKSMVEHIHTVLVPNGVDTTYFRPMQNTSDAGENNIIFTGSYSYFPNEQAAYYFATKIFPTIITAIPNAKYYIIGRSPSRRLLGLHNNQNIIVTDEVEDIRLYLAKAHVVVVPIQFGGGTRLKVLEALAAAKAVVSTSIGCEGIDVENGKDLIIADDDGEFADSVISLLNNSQEASLLGSRGRSVIENKYSWDSIIANFQTAIEKYTKTYSQLSERLDENRN